MLNAYCLMHTAKRLLARIPYSVFLIPERLKLVMLNAYCLMHTAKKPEAF